MTEKNKAALQVCVTSLHVAEGMRTARLIDASACAFQLGGSNMNFGGHRD